jgi:hypothetical protein
MKKKWLVNRAGIPPVHVLTQQFPDVPTGVWKLHFLTRNQYPNENLAIPIQYKMNLALSAEMFPLGYPANMLLPQTQTGLHGNLSAPPLTLIQPCKKLKTSSCQSSSSHIITIGATYLPARLQSVVEQWATPIVPFARCWPTWESMILDSSHLGN